MIGILYLLSQESEVVKCRKISLNYLLKQEEFSYK